MTSPNKNLVYDVLGIGAPLIDHVIQVNENFLNSLHAAKGSMKSIDSPSFSHLLDLCHDSVNLRMGGSCANVMKGLAQLGHACAFLGKIGEDDKGVDFTESLGKSHVIPLMIKSSTPTGQVACFVTPDGERTFLDYLGASRELSSSDLKIEMFQGIKLVHLEGFTLLNQDLTLRAMELAKTAGVKVSFDLSNFELVREHKSFIISLISKYVDLLFANHDETQMLTGCDSEKGCKILKDLCDIVVCTMGSQGCWIGQGSKQHHCPAYPVVPIDTTGAGDLFAAGFLHGYLNGDSMIQCAHYGALTSAAVVKVFGAEISDKEWENLRFKIQTHLT
jgi:sugar/nucleoside kinase (ribokinase family)